ncbi:MAG TPA: CPBP family intramembrane glutamic endopeptidase [Bacteroidia bacterium]|jgi:membrane protease YdiL (CAAX protease family)
MIKNIFYSAFTSSEAGSFKKEKPDLKVILICITVAFSLTMIKYLGDVRFMIGCLHDYGFNGLTAAFEDLMTINKNAQLYRLLYWVMIMIVFYLIVPLIMIKLVFRERLSGYGLKLRGAFKDYKLYVYMLCVMIPLVIYFSSTESFQQRYPFYDVRKGDALYPNFIIWEVFYFLQFFALEFFFRGFMLHGTKQRFGYYSVLVMTIPYCMIHFGKPLPETVAAIIAGLVLGTLSLKSKSIWLGVAIHYSVAITMDLCAMYQKGLF